MFKRVIKGAYFGILSAVRADVRAVSALQRNNLVLVLNLHRVSPEPNPFWPAMSPTVFASLLEFLTCHFHVTGFDEIVDDTSSRPCAVLSFDDGYSDFVDYALPIMDRYGVRANMNLIPSCVLTAKPIWNVQLYDFLFAASVDRVNDLPIKGFNEKLKDSSETSKMRFGISISRFLKTRSREDRESLLAEIQPLLNSDGGATSMMNVKDVKALAGKVHFGAHSYSHESMGYESDEFFADDLQRCEKFFDAKLGFQLDTYAFPNGSYRESQIEHLRSHGVKNILLVDEKPARKGTGIYTRVTTYGETRLEARFKALGY